MSSSLLFFKNALSLKLGDLKFRMSGRDYQNLTLLEGVNVDQKIILKYILHECHLKIWKVFFLICSGRQKKCF